MSQMQKTKNKVIIFDCDGTIVDTYTLIIQTVYKTFEKLLPDYPLTKKEAHDFFGPLLDDSFKKYTSDPKFLQELISCYRQINNELMKDYIYAYDGIETLLQELKNRNYKIAILSNKTSDSVKKGLEICNITKYFDLIVGAEKLSMAKPDPNGIYQVQEYFDTLDVIMIGDTIIDIKTGQNAGIKTIGVTWCQTIKEEFINNNATYVVAHPTEILELIEE